MWKPEIVPKRMALTDSCHPEIVLWRPNTHWRRTGFALLRSARQSVMRHMRFCRVLSQLSLEVRLEGDYL